MKKITEEYYEYNNLFTNYDLTALMLLKNKSRKIKHNENQALRFILSEKLKEYGIILLDGSFTENGLTFRTIVIPHNFPIENEPIFQQLYGYENFNPIIFLKSDSDEYSLSFRYFPKTKECVLEKHRYGTRIEENNFNNLSEMLDYLNKRYD